jgi:hypothetical protein
MHTHDFVTYEEFGRRFFEVAVTEDRVAAAFAAIAGDQFEMGPFGQGPGKIARISAKVQVGKPQVSRHIGEEITFSIRIPLTIDLVIDLRIDKQRFNVSGEVALRATARAAEPLLLIIDVAKPRSTDITVDVSSTSMRGEILRVLAGVDDEVRRFIAGHVANQIEDPASQAAQVIDVAEQLDTTWTGI